jgi:hypothetical protein
MKVVYSPHHILHNPPKEFISNHVAAYGESPERAELIYEALMDIRQVTLIRAEQLTMNGLQPDCGRKVFFRNFLQSVNFATTLLQKVRKAKQVSI